MAIPHAPYRAYLYDRGGMRRIPVQLVDVQTYKWTRKRDDISTAEVHLVCPSRSAAREIGDVLATGRQEVVIFRGRDRVWEGPITRAVLQGTKIDLFAKDVCHYLYRTVMRAAYNNAGLAATSAIDRVQRIITAELARKEALDPPINVLPYMNYIHRTDDARTARSTLQRQSTVWEDMDSLAHRAGIDYVTVGRQITVWDTHYGLGRMATVTEDDFIGEVLITEYGMDLCTEDTVTDGQGNWAVAGGLDPYYGWVEILHTAYDEDDGGPVPSVAEMAEQAERNLKGRNPVPIEVRIPQGSRINPQGVWTLKDLVPGTHIPLRATLAARDLTQLQKLSEVNVVVDKSGEVITIAMDPASSLVVTDGTEE